MEHRTSVVDHQQTSCHMNDCICFMGFFSFFFLAITGVRSRFLSLVRLPSRWRPRDSLSSNLFRRQLRQMEASFKASTVLLLPFGIYIIFLKHDTYQVHLWRSSVLISQGRICAHLLIQDRQERCQKFGLPWNHYRLPLRSTFCGPHP
ncbi:uncharacterized protein BDW43DRAFT_153179 [Aspergillus alliaceus]|uniref:uncharacterized protein n=1 Tax=Petromyces alliaceus TaxID=209559 RepID=UPI0012A4B958|nr:uncharacterized protein BDW43DRAFT_153179 [Aspergillus alliaceus]KAB8238119.1 hypothetical protein BDW43DRAFT_153179 [Aspergillus alliaceus]